MTIDVLGTEYTIEQRTKDTDPFLSRIDGYCDKTSKLIVITKKEKDCELANFEVYRKKILRHEIIHAFLFESGLHENWTHEMGHDETYVDWIAVQFPKILKAFQKLGAVTNRRKSNDTTAERYIDKHFVGYRGADRHILRRIKSRTRG